MFIPDKTRRLGQPSPDLQLQQAIEGFENALTNCALPVVGAFVPLSRR
jgi:hypothetical protein